jgi:hypothetical protein
MHLSTRSLVLAAALALAAASPAAGAPPSTTSVNEPDGAASPKRMRLMTAEQYINTLGRM